MFNPGQLFSQDADPAKAETESSTVRGAFSGTEIAIDDSWFEGCYHDAFEGILEKNEDGSLKPGKQGIQRTKAILSGVGTSHSAMTLRFELKEAPSGPVQLDLTGLDDGFEAQNKVEVSVNDQKITEDLTFPNNQYLDNARYYLGWETKTLKIPENVLRQGENTLVISNRSSSLDSQNWNYVAIDEIKFGFSKPVSLRLEGGGEMPVLYYGLTEGAEVNAWPAVNLNNRICLIKGAPLQVSFFVTMPKDKPLGTEGPLAEQATKITRKILLHLETDADLQVLDAKGVVVAGESKGGKRQYEFPIPRLLNFETPHPAQGVTLFMRGGKPFEAKELRAWMTIDGVPYRDSVYQIRNVELQALKDRDALKFDLGIWGGQIPSTDPAQAEYIAAARAAGFNQLFTGQDQKLNTALKKAGFHVYPRYGWFGHQFKVSEELAKFAAIDASGKPMLKDFCPIAILENPTHPELGKFFKRAQENAAQTDIDGICVDFETAPVWCYDEKCQAKFEEETGLKIKNLAQIAPGGELAEAYTDFGRRRNRDLLAKVKEIIKTENPELEYHSLASASDIPSYWYDGRVKARHSVEELTTFADAIYASCYFYEIPGGLKSVIPIIDTVQGYAHQSGREVGTYIISPVATTISEFPRYRGTWMKPDFTKLLIQLAGLGGARGVLLFRGDCFDGEYFLACQDAIASLQKVQPYLEHRIDRSYEITLRPEPGVDWEYDTEVAPHLLGRLMWRPAEEYEYDAVQLLRESNGNQRLVAVFNFSAQPRSYSVSVRGLFDPEYAATDVLTGEALGTMRRIDVEGGKWSLEVPARSCRLIELSAQPDKS